MPIPQVLLQTSRSTGERLALVSNSVACLLLGLIGEARADWAGAVRHYAKGCGIEAGALRTRYFLRNNLAFSLLQLGQCAAAEDYCREAIALAPDIHNAYKNLGLSLRGQQRHAEAAEAFLAAARRRPEDGRALTHLREMVRDLAGLVEEGDDPRFPSELAAGGK